MAEQDRPKAVVNGQSVDKLARKMPPKLLLGLILLVLLVAGYGAYHLLHKSKTKITQMPAVQTLNPANATDSQKLISDATQTDISKYTKAQKATYYSTLANFYVAKKDYKNALSNFKKALSFNPNDPSTLENTGYVLTKLGQNSQAKTYYQSARTQYQKIGTDVAGISDKISEIDRILQKL